MTRALALFILFLTAASADGEEIRRASASLPLYFRTEAVPRTGNVALEVTWKEEESSFKVFAALPIARSDLGELSLAPKMDLVVREEDIFLAVGLDLTAERAFRAKNGFNMNAGFFVGYAHEFTMRPGENLRADHVHVGVSFAALRKSPGEVVSSLSFRVRAGVDTRLPYNDVSGRTVFAALAEGHVGLYERCGFNARMLYERDLNKQGERLQFRSFVGCRVTQAFRIDGGVEIPNLLGEVGFDSEPRLVLGTPLVVEDGAWLSTETKISATEGQDSQFMVRVTLADLDPLFRFMGL